MGEPTFASRKRLHERIRELEQTLAQARQERDEAIKNLDNLRQMSWITINEVKQERDDLKFQEKESYEAMLRLEKERDTLKTVLKTYEEKYGTLD